MLDGARALLFDLDGTLVDTAPAIARALSSMRRARGASGDVPSARVRGLVSSGADALVAGVLDDVRRDASADLREFRAVLSAQPPSEVLFPGVREALAAAVDARMPMAVVTNKPHALSVNLLARFGLVHHFRAIVGGDSAEAPKPHPSPMQAGLTAVAAPPGRVVYIGDSAVDALAAEAVGVRFAVFEGGYAPSECPPELVHLRLTDFHHLARWIRARPQGADISVCYGGKT